MTFFNSKQMHIVDGHGPWNWPSLDTGAWEGPVQDWITSHKSVIQRLSSHRNVIQAGGNCGLYPVLLTQFFDHVYTIEPDEQNFFFLSSNTKDNPKISANRLAVGATSGYVSMRCHSPDNVGANTVDEGGHDVEMTTIDNLYSGVDNIDLIWLDIEGYEYNALSGAENVILKHLPVIGVERADARINVLLSTVGYTAVCVSKMDTFFAHPNGVSVRG